MNCEKRELENLKHFLLIKEKKHLTKCKKKKIFLNLKKNQGRYKLPNA